MHQKEYLPIIGTSQLLFRFLLSLTTIFTLCQSWSHLWGLRLPFQVLTFGRHEIKKQLPSDTLMLPKGKYSLSSSYTISFPLYHSCQISFLGQSHFAYPGSLERSPQYSESYPFYVTSLHYSLARKRDTS